MNLPPLGKIPEGTRGPHWEAEMPPLPTPEPVLDTQGEITQVCYEVKEMLLEKNRRYGDSALDPVRVFSKADTVEQIKVRLDDKLSRLSRGSGTEDEDVLNDILGYIILLKIALARAA